MKANVGHLDRATRVVVGIQMMALGLSQAIGGAAGAALVMVGAVLLVTGALGRCWLYQLLGLNTVRELPIISP